MKSILMKGIYSCRSLVWNPLLTARVSFLIHLHLIPLLHHFCGQPKDRIVNHQQSPWTVFNALLGLPAKTVYAGG